MHSFSCALLIVLMMATPTRAVDFAKIPGCCNAFSDILHPAISSTAQSVAYIERYIVPPDFTYSYIRLSDIGAGVPGYNVFDYQYLYPSYSPDGSKLAVVYCAGFADNPDPNGIWILSDDGSPGQRIAEDVTPGTCFGRVAWLNDSALLFEGPGEELHMAFLGGTGAFSTGIRGHSPHAREDAMVYVRDGNIWIGGASGHRQLTSAAAEDDWPSWSGDGEWIVFSSDRSGNEDLWVISSEGGTPIQLTTNPGYDGQPTWSEDGETIVFLSDRGGRPEVWMATDLPDWTVAVDAVPWSHVKTMFR